MQWVDGSEDNRKKIRSVEPILNVAEFQFDENNKLENVSALKTNGVLAQNKNYK